MIVFNFGILIATTIVMIDTTFYIVENIRSADGYQSIGKFFMGNDKDSALNIFHKLKGSSKVDDKAMLTLELRETKNELPLNLLMISCTLEEFAENSRIITKEIFKLFNLDISGNAN